jgi:ankyrin repeat protein
MTSKFVTRREIEEAKRAELFQCLDDTNVRKCDTFLGLCQSIESKEIIINARDRRKGYEGRTLLHNAARTGKLTAIKYLISIFHSVDPVDSSVNLVTPLMDAIAFHHMDVADYLVRAGASITRQDMKGENALHYAARSGSAGMVSTLVAACGLERESLKSAASMVSVRLKFPEDVSANAHSWEILVDLREQGERRKLPKQANFPPTA